MKNMIQNIRRWAGLPIFIIVLVLIGINTALTDNFLSSNVVRGFLSTYAPLIFVAVAQALVIMSGGIDLSLGGIVSVANVTTIVLIGAGWDFYKVGPAGGLYICNTPGACQEGWSFVAAAFGGILLGTFVGFVNGFTVGILRVRPLLATLATQFISMGMALYLLPLPGGRIQSDVFLWYSGSYLGIPISAWAIIIMAILWVLLVKSPFGFHIKAIGRSTQYAYNSAVPVQKTILLTYVLAGLIASIGGILLTMVITAGDSAVGSAFALNSIAAAVLGGISLSGGEGEVSGPIFGALFLGLIVNTILGAKIPAFYQWLASGLIILIGLIASIYLRDVMRMPKEFTQSKTLNSEKDV